MHTRRKFLTQSSFTLGAVGFLKPLQSLAGTSASAQQRNSLTILFTNGFNGKLTGRADAGGIEAVKGILHDARRSAGNILLLDSGNILSENATKTIDDLNVYKAVKASGYDAITPGANDLQHGKEYYARLVDRSRVTAIAANQTEDEVIRADRIIRKGTIKIGVIGVGSADNFSANQFQQLLENVMQRARKLKQTHRCQLVICLSHLPLKNEESAIDNFSLSQASDSIDIVISANDERFMYNTHVLKNSKGEDVFLSHAGQEGTMVGKLAISFNEKGEKTAIATEQLFAGYSGKDGAMAFRKHAASQLA